MFDDCAAVSKMNGNGSKEDYAVRNGELDQKCFISWSPLEENKFLFKHRYVSCSRSAPQRSKRFVRYRISRSLNFETSARSSSSENSSFEEDKHLSRSAKIMRALNFNSSPSYYGKTKIKKSLNFNLTPSPKRFMPVKKSIRKSLSLNFQSPLSVASNKSSRFDASPISDSAKSNLLFSSSESIDENQNETPLQQTTKEQEMLLYSTPNAKLSKRGLCPGSFTPLLRHRLRETIDNIVYIRATPNGQPLPQQARRRSSCTSGVATNTSRNLFYEFHDDEDDRPCTPENVICILPESMSAIKRSHKKERSSRRNEHCATQRASKFTKDGNASQDESSPLLSRRRENDGALEDCETSRIRYSATVEEVPPSHSEDDMSDTGSLFDYTGEQEYPANERREEIACASSCANVRETYTDVKAERYATGSSELASLAEHAPLPDSINPDESGPLLRADGVDSASDVRSATPEPAPDTALEVQRVVTPENRINILERVANDSIKKSHKKTKDNNKRRLFSPIVLHGKMGIAEPQANEKCDEQVETTENAVEGTMPAEHSCCLDTAGEKRSGTPEKLSSSRLLLSQYSSVKKSHKKDKHNNILSGFLKRQEYFGRETESARCSSRHKAFDIGDASVCTTGTGDLSSDADVSANLDDQPTCSTARADPNASVEKLSPSKRKQSLDLSMDCAANTSSDSELLGLDTSKAEFQIFTPLKRKRSAIAAATAKECLNFCAAPSETDDRIGDSVAGMNFSRCLTPIPKLQDVYAKVDDSVCGEDATETRDCTPSDTTGRSTPRNMSTAELYVSLDSIKKSHRKNKRGNGSRKRTSAVRDRLGAAGGGIGASTEKIGNQAFGVLDVSDDSTDSGDHDAIGNSVSNESAADSEELASPVTEANASSSVTPPNCLKIKNYMTLLRETSIKRSHKKVREQRRQEFMIDAIDLSDDGSIFGDEEKLDIAEKESTHD